MQDTRSFSPYPLSRRGALRLALGIAASCPQPGPAWAQSSPAGRPKSSARPPDTTIALEIPLDGHGSRIDKAYAGFSYEKRQLQNGFFSCRNEPLVRLFNYLGSGVLRIGGNSVDQMVWREGRSAAKRNEITEVDVDALASFLAATGWRVIYGINLAYNTPAQAAEEAAYVAQRLGPLLSAFEIGNEPDAYALNGNRSTSYSYRDFLGEWRSFAQAIRQAAPAASLSGPASAWHESSWTEPFAYDEARNISLLTQHYYRANGLSPQSTLNFLLAGDPALPSLLTGLREASKGAGIPLGYRLTEANSFYDGGAPHISNTFGSALWALDFLFITAFYGASGVNFHGGGSAPGYTPIADDGRKVLEVRPEYYAMLLFASMGQGELVHAAQTVRQLSVSTYAVAMPDERKVLIVNKEPLLDVQILLSGDFIYDKVTTMALTAPSLLSTQEVALGGASIGSDGLWRPSAPLLKKIGYTPRGLSLGPASAVLLTLPKTVNRGGPRYPR